MVKIAWLGFGLMGSAAAAKHVKAGHDVTGWNRSMDKVKKVDGVKPCESVEEAIKGAEYIFSCLAKDDAVQEVYKQVVPKLQSGQVVVEMSTVHPETSRAVAKQVQGKSCVFMDAPIVGSPVSIAHDKATVYVGCDDKQAYDKAQELIKCVGPTVVHTGGVGSAEVLKIATNMSVINQVTAMAESVLLAEKNGIDRNTAVDVMLKTAIASPALQYRGPYLKQLPDNPLFPNTLALKDAELAKSLAEASGVKIPVMRVSADLMKEAIDKGYGQDDFASLSEVLRGQSGIKELAKPLKQRKK